MSNSTTAYEQLKAMGEACIGNTPQQVESLAKQVEWKNGDDCHYHSTPNVPSKFVAMHPNNPKAAIIWEGGGDCNLACVAIECLRKPESPQEKAKRERKEYSKQIFLDMGYHDNLWVDNPDEANSIQVEEAISSCYELYDAGYRKGE